MEIREIKNPLFLKDLDQNELKNVCNDIREFIIDYTSQNGGYLSGNLSAVELSVMLNKVFSSDDVLIFDGNDLNYTNKILNGMVDKLQFNCNGAYSLANALGLAASRDLEHKDYNVVCVVNSSDLLSGRNIETLNLISNSGKRLIIVFNDDTTIDRGIGLIDRLISGLRTTKGYTNLKDNVKDLIRPAKKGDKIIENIHNFKTNIKKTMLDEGIFSEFNIDYIGPIDGHDLNDLNRAFEIAKEKTYPAVVHCITTKGKGFRYAEASTSDAWNKVGKFDKENGKMLASEKDNYLYAKNIVGMTMEKLMGINDDIVCVTSRNINDYGVANIFAKYPQRCFDTVSSAENSLSFASGLALDGKIPFITLRSFELLNAFKELNNQINKLYRPMIIGFINDGNLNYDLLANLNNVYIYEPEDSKKLQNALYTGISLDKPLIVIYPEKCIEFNEINDFSQINLGIWEKSANNDMNKVAVFASGTDLKQIKEIIDSNELPYDLINTASYSPMDEECLKEILENHEHLFFYGHKLETKILKYLNRNSCKATVEFIDEEGINTLFDRIKDKLNA